MLPRPRLLVFHDHDERVVTMVAVLTQQTRRQDVRVAVEREVLRKLRPDAIGGDDQRVLILQRHDFGLEPRRKAIADDSRTQQDPLGVALLGRAIEHGFDVCRCRSTSSSCPAG
jgi:hypothetical protein